MIEIGRAFMVSHQLAHAARVACRAGAIEGKSSAEVSSMASSTLSAQGISGAVIVVKVNGKVADSSTTVFGDTITVEATVPVSAVTWLPTGRFLSGQLARQYSMRRE
jgi:Flp pilus assembly protein TadG